MVFFVLPRMKAAAVNSISSRGIPAAGPALESLDREYLDMTLFLIVLALVMLACSVYLAKRLMQPAGAFIEQAVSRLRPAGKGSLRDVVSGIDTLCRNISIMDNVPMGIMVVDPAGIITFFNREAGVITGLDPAEVLGRPANRLFPNNFCNYTTEVLNTGREYLGLRNIIKVGGSLRELLFSVSPIRPEGSISGVVAVFQDVTPQRRLIEVRATYTLARDLAAQNELDGAAGVIAGAVAEITEIEWVAVYLADSSGNLAIRASRGIPDSLLEAYGANPLNADSPEVRSIYRNRVPLLHGNLDNSPSLAALALMPEARSFYSFPFLSGDRVIGFLNLCSRDRDSMSRDTAYFVQLISEQVNTAIAGYYESS